MKTEFNADQIPSRAMFLEAIVQSAIDYAIISMDLDGLVTSWNEGARRILGWTEAEMIGRPATAFFTREDREAGVPQSEMTSALNVGRGSDERWHVREDGTCFWASGEMMALKADDGSAIGFLKILRDRTEQREQADRQRLLMHELGHRMKNTLAVVQSIVTQSMRNATSVEDALEKLQARLNAYSKAHDILLQKQWLSATLRHVVESAIATIELGDSGRIVADGPDVILGPQAALTFSLVLHELLTNACKYGALTKPEGRVKITWSIGHENGEEMLVSTWTECGGPVVTEPTRKGFGSRLIMSSLQAYGRVSVNYAPEGLIVRTDMPIKGIQYHSELPEVDPVP